MTLRTVMTILDRKSPNEDAKVNPLQEMVFALKKGEGYVTVMTELTWDVREAKTGQEEERWSLKLTLNSELLLHTQALTLVYRLGQLNRL